jgi:hypothetical protein
MVAKTAFRRYSGLPTAAANSPGALPVTGKNFPHFLSGLLSGFGYLFVD